MDIPNQLLEIRIFLAHNRFVSILKKVTVAVMPAVKRYGITGQQAPHIGRESERTTPKQDVRMVVQQGPGINHGIRFNRNPAHSVH
jgi:hypothetical protein